MSKSRYKVINDSAHIMHCTALNWLPLFNNPAITLILLKSLRFLQDQKRLQIHGYVILENHIHLIASAKDLNKEMKSFKSFTARSIIDCLREKQYHSLLKQLNFHKLRHRNDRNYQVWEEGFHPQLIQNMAMMQQKLEYIHNNPVRRGYVDEPVHWRYSSARNYAGLEGVLEIEIIS